MLDNGNVNPSISPLVDIRRKGGPRKPRDTRGLSRNALAERTRQRIAEIKALWLQLQPTPFHWPPTPERIRDLLPYRLSVNGVRFYMYRIRLNAGKGDA